MTASEGAAAVAETAPAEAGPQRCSCGLTFEELGARVFGTPAPGYGPPRYLEQQPSILAGFDALAASLRREQEAAFLERQHAGDDAILERVFPGRFRPRHSAPQPHPRLTAPGEAQPAPEAPPVPADVPGPAQQPSSPEAAGTAKAGPGTAVAPADDDPAAVAAQAAAEEALARWTPPVRAAAVTEAVPTAEPGKDAPPRVSDDAMFPVLDALASHKPDVDAEPAEDAPASNAGEPSSEAPEQEDPLVTDAAEPAEGTEATP